MSEWTEGEAVDKSNQVKPSKWWSVYHLWAGMCIKIFSDLSGLSKLLLTPTSSTPTASTYATTAAILAVGLVTIGYFGSKSLLKQIEASALSHHIKLSVKSILPIAYLVVAVLLAVAVAPLINASSQSGATVTPTVTSGEIAPIITFDTIQSADGLTEADFELSGLKNIETWLVDVILEKMRPIFAELGVNPIEYESSVSANSVFVNVANKKLGIIKIQLGNYVRSVAIVGFMGSEFHRVTCLRKSNHDIPVWSGECGNRVQQVFGVSVKP